MPNELLYKIIPTETFDSQSIFPKTKDSSQVTQAERDDFLEKHWYSGRIIKGNRKEYYDWVTEDLKNRDKNDEKISETEILTIKQEYEKIQLQKRIENEKFWTEQRLEKVRAIAEKKQAKLDRKQNAKLNKKTQKAQKKTRKTEKQKIAINRIAEIRVKKNSKLTIKKAKINKKIISQQQVHLTQSNNVNSKKDTKNKKTRQQLPENQILITIANHKNSSNYRSTIKSNTIKQNDTIKKQIENLKFDFSNLKTITFDESYWKKLQSHHNLQIPSTPTSYYCQTTNNQTIDQISHDFAEKVVINDSKIINDKFKNFTISAKDWQDAGPSCAEDIMTSEINQLLSHSKSPAIDLSESNTNTINTKPKFGHKKLRNLSDSRITGKGHGIQPIIVKVFSTTQQLDQQKKVDEQTKIKLKSKLSEKQKHSEISFSFN